MSSSTAKCHQVAQRTHPWQHLLRASILCNNRPRIFQYSTSTGALTVLPTTTHPKRYIICVYARPRPQPPSACKHPNFQRPSFLPSNSRSVASTGTSPPPAARTDKKNGSSLCCPVCMSVTRCVRDAGLRGRALRAPVRWCRAALRAVLGPRTCLLRGRCRL